MTITNHKKILFIFIQLSCLSFFFIYCQSTSQEPSWVYLKRAENYKETGEYAAAIISAKQAKAVHIKERLKVYYETIRKQYRDKIEYELKQMVAAMENQLYLNDDYPQYHKLMGDLYVLTDMLDDAENEYKIALMQKSFFDYPQEEIEIKYKMADIYNKNMDFELADLVYRDIIKTYFDQKNNLYWDRIRENISSDYTLNHVFRIYRIDGIEYLPALYKIGRRSAMLQRKNEALFFLSNAAIVWMTYYAGVIKKYHYDFQYANPSDFVNYIAKKRLYEYETKEYIMDEILFFIGYIFYLEGENKIKDNYFNLARIFSKDTPREEEIDNLITFLNKNKGHILGYQELLN